MSLFAAVFAGVAVSAAQDVFEVVAHASSRTVIREIHLAQYSDAGDAAAELLSVQIIRGYTTSGSGGSSVTPGKWASHSGAPAAVTTVEANNTTVAQDGTGIVLFADGFNVMDGWHFVPPEPIVVQPGQRLVVRITAPADAVTLNGTLLFEETGLQVLA